MRTPLALALLLLLALAGCVYVGRHGSYSETNNVEQHGTNRSSSFELSPR